MSRYRYYNPYLIGEAVLEYRKILREQTPLFVALVARGKAILEYRRDLKERGWELRQIVPQAILELRKMMRENYS